MRKHGHACASLLARTTNPIQSPTKRSHTIECATQQRHFSLSPAFLFRWRRWRLRGVSYLFISEFNQKPFWKMKYARFHPFVFNLLLRSNIEWKCAILIETSAQGATIKQKMAKCCISVAWPTEYSISFITLMNFDSSGSMREWWCRPVSSEQRFCTLIFCYYYCNYIDVVYR